MGGRRVGGGRVGREMLTSRTVVGLSALETVGETFKLQRTHSNPFTNTLSSLHSLLTPPLLSPHNFSSPQSPPSTVYLLILSCSLLPPPPLCLPLRLQTHTMDHLPYHVFSAACTPPHCPSDPPRHRSGSQQHSPLTWLPAGRPGNVPPCPWPHAGPTAWQVTG